MTARGGDSVAAWHGGSEPGDGLRAFTSTAEVPALARAADLGPWSAPTGTVPAIPFRRRPAPFGLRMAVWVEALLVVVGLAALAVHAVRPSALASLEAGKSSSSSATVAAPSSPHPSQAHHPSGPVSLSQTSPTTASVTVNGAQYTVVVNVTNRCWVQVTSPASSTPVFAGILAAGDQQAFKSANGQLGVELGASGATVTVETGAKNTAVWHFTPTAAPFDLSFMSASQ